MKSDFIKQGIKFGMVGASGLVIGLSVLNLMMILYEQFLLANIIAFFVAVTWNFFLNRQFTFERTSMPICQQWLKFVFGCLGASIIGWGVSCTLYETVMYLQHHYNYAAIAGTFSSAGCNFIWARFMVFRGKNSESTFCTGMAGHVVN